jgi:predicted YcjX-like family ATPase
VPAPPTTITDEIGIALGNLADAASGAITPTLRLGVTGLSRAGKTIFITALVHALTSGGRLPAFGPLAEGRFIGARLAESPDPDVPRFAYEAHIEALMKGQWPESTRRISELRIELKYHSTRWPQRRLGPQLLNLDIVDYPGEWLLDLPLLSQTYAEWSTGAMARAEGSEFAVLAASTDPLKDANEPDAAMLASAFAMHLGESRKAALSTLPPGRFLMPGDLEGSPALTFAPLPPQPGMVRHDSLYAMLERRYESYKHVVVRPFFRDHFARLDRQIVLVDTLRALNAGPDAVADLETALTDILACFRQGDSNPLTRLWARKIDRILFAATKADHLHSSSHDRLEAILNRLVAKAIRRAKFAGAETRSLALAAVRATREGTIDEGNDTLNAVIGTPQAGEELDGISYDGKTEIALFPGDLPTHSDSILDPGMHMNFLRFLPPRVERNEDGAAVLPHIRFDRALDFLIGDKLR